MKEAGKISSELILDAFSVIVASSINGLLPKASLAALRLCCREAKIAVDATLTAARVSAEDLLPFLDRGWTMTVETLIAGGILPSASIEALLQTPLPRLHTLQLGIIERGPPGRIYETACTRIMNLLIGNLKACAAGEERKTSTPTIAFAATDRHCCSWSKCTS